MAVAQEVVGVPVYLMVRPEAEVVLPREAWFFGHRRDWQCGGIVRTAAGV